MCLSVLENKCQIILEMSVLPSLRAKILYTVWDEIPCLWAFPLLLHMLCHKFSTFKWMSPHCPHQWDCFVLLYPFTEWFKWTMPIYVFLLSRHIPPHITKSNCIEWAMSFCHLHSLYGTLQSFSSNTYILFLDEPIL